MTCPTLGKWLQFPEVIREKWIEKWIASCTIYCKLLIIKGGSSSVAERQLPKLNVAGSIPVSRSIKSISELLAKFDVGNV